MFKAQNNRENLRPWPGSDGAVDFCFLYTFDAAGINFILKKTALHKKTRRCKALKTGLLLHLKKINLT